MPASPLDRALSLDQACEAIAATPARLRTLRVVMDHSEVTAKGVMAELNLSRSAAGYHLSALMAAGLIHERRATHPRGSGPVIYWAADRQAINALRDALVEHLASPPSG